MEINDPVLPAVGYLTSDDAFGPLAAAVGRAGGSLVSCRATHVQYRPAVDIVVRYRCDVVWPEGRRRRDILVAAASTRAPLHGAIPVVADLDTDEVAVSVWRWPFDPVLPGLTPAVTATDLVGVLGGLDVALGPDPVAIEVVAYRPTERAVVRVTQGDVVSYVKVVPPPETAALVERHRRLGDAGLPVPEVVAADEDLGFVVLAELAGTTLRDRVKEDLGGWPDPDEFARLFASIASVPTSSMQPAADRMADAFGHAALLQTIAPESSTVLDQILEVLPVAEAASAERTVVHGDLHEGQLIVDACGSVAGLLDIDDMGTGSAVSDPATLIAHLRFRASTGDDEERARRLLAYTDRLRDACAPLGAPGLLDATVAAALVGLATGPFRIQREGWRDDIDAVLADAHHLVSVG